MHPRDPYKGYAERDTVDDEREHRGVGDEAEEVVDRKVGGCERDDEADGDGRPRRLHPRLNKVHEFVCAGKKTDDHGEEE